jgi:type VI secretion system protein ImpH
MPNIVFQHINLETLNKCSFLQLLSVLDYLDSRLGKKLKVRFVSCMNLKFPEREIEKITVLENNQQLEIEIVVNFLSIIGATGVLPSHYIEYVQECRKNKDSSLMDFINIFHDRLIKIFIKIKKLGNLEFTHNNSKQQESEDINLNLIRSILGIMPNMATKIVPDFLLNYTGILAQTSKSELNLRIILSNYLGYPVEIKQFVEEKIALKYEQLSRLGKNSNLLGSSLYLGKSAYFYQNKILINIPALDFITYSRFVQDGDLKIKLEQILDLYLDKHFSYEIAFLVLENEKVTQLQYNFPRSLGRDIWCKC